MNMSIKINAVMLAVLLLGSASAVPLELTYQGQLYKDNVAVGPDGVTQVFAFAMITNGVVTWNSGNVTTYVFRGFFSVPLGNTNVTAALPAGIFDNDNVYLRVQVATMGAAFTMLTPSNKITSSAYAISARNVSMSGGNAMYGGGNNTIIMTGAPLLTNPVWDDIRVPLDSAGDSSTVTRPSYNPLGTTRLYLYDFDKAKDESMNFTCQIPHTYKAGSSLCPHIHWINKYAQGSRTATTNVVWGFEYQIKWINEPYSSTTSTTILCTNSLPTVLNTHILSDLPMIPGTGIKESSIIIGRVFRAGSNPADTYDNDATILEIDFHFQVEKMGTINEIPN